MNPFGLRNIAAVLTVPVLLAGCSILSPERVEVKEFDLTALPPKRPLPQPALPVRIGVFRNYSGAVQVLMHREAGNVMRQESGRRLYQPVENLIAREILRAFGTGDHARGAAGSFLLLSGELLKFEIDHVEKCARLEMKMEAAQYESNVRKKQVCRLFLCRVPLKEFSSAGELAALEACVGKLVFDCGELLTAAAAPETKKP